MEGKKGRDRGREERKKEKRKDKREGRKGGCAYTAGKKAGERDRIWKGLLVFE